MNCEFEDKIFNIQTADFEKLALEVFRFQALKNPVYRSFIEALRINYHGVQRLAEIPFLPISSFKTARVITGEFEASIQFESSGTSGAVTSRHLVKDTVLYQRSFLNAFRQFYGAPDQWCILGLLPSYLERSASSLVYMVRELIRESGNPLSGFYLYDHGKLRETLQAVATSGQKALLIGVSFALVDFAVAGNPLPPGTIVMETGGMKGRRAEITREELHAVLTEGLGVKEIHSEYGMTELLSQAYSPGQGRFQSPPWMKVMVRDEDDPLSVKERGKGIFNVIDLANIYSCSFIATDDIGLLHSDGSFEVQGRLDNSDIRGCSLMVADLG